MVAIVEQAVGGHQGLDTTGRGQVDSQRLPAWLQPKDVLACCELVRMGKITPAARFKADAARASSIG